MEILVKEKEKALSESLIYEDISGASPEFPRKKRSRKDLYASEQDYKLIEYLSVLLKELIFLVKSALLYNI